MSDLRSIMGELGFSDVATLLNSGNVVFSGCDVRKADAAALIAASLADRLGVDVPVTVLGASDLTRAVSCNPFSDQVQDPSRLIVAFPADQSEMVRLAPLAERDWGSERLALGESEAYLSCPGGVAHSPLMRCLGDVLCDRVTSRNWRTVLKLMAMVDKD
jgi:uncharacterized protein (DUF1697 family)